MPLTPVEILHKEFKRALRGYNDTEVQEFLRDVAREHERLVAELARLKEEKQSLQQRLAQFERMEDTLQKTLVMAQTAAEDTRKNAQRRADVIVREAENQRDTIIANARANANGIEQDAARRRAQGDQFEAQFRAMLRAHEELLNQSDLASRPIATAPAPSPPIEPPPIPVLAESAMSPKVQNGHDDEPALAESAPRAPLINWRGIPHD